MKSLSTESENKIIGRAVANNNMSSKPIAHSYLGIQAKLKIGKPGDKYEQQADRVAEQVMRMPELPVQRQCPECEVEKERIQSKPISEWITPLVQRQVEEEEEEEPIQTKSNNGEGMQASSELQSQLQFTKGSGIPLPSHTNQFMSHAFGTDFSHVRVHTGQQANDMNKSIQAKAFTHGSDIYMKSGQYNPASNKGKWLLAHELTHTIQQNVTCFKSKKANTKLVEGNESFNMKPEEEEKENVRMHSKYDYYPKIGLSSPYGLIQRRARDVFSPADFCKPYKSDNEAKQAWEEMKRDLIPFETRLFGTEVANLYATYLKRRKGDSLKPRLFESPRSSIVKGFMNSTVTFKRTKELAYLIRDKLDKSTECPIIADNQWIEVPVECLLPPKELNSTGPGGETQSDIDFGMIGEIPGNIAGGVGSSDAGADTRRVTGNVRFHQKRDDLGKVTKSYMQTDFIFIVKDAIDFCSGQPGALFEWQFTIPLSRLEKKNYAYDTPYIVKYKGPVFELTLSDKLNNCWPEPSQKPIPFQFKIQARLPESRFFYIKEGSEIRVTCNARYETNILPVGVGLQYYISLRGLNSDEGSNFYQINRKQTHTWKNLKAGTYYLEIGKNEPGGFSPFILNGTGVIEIKNPI
jgi:hypothetical protein